MEEAEKLRSAHAKADAANGGDHQNKVCACVRVTEFACMRVCAFVHVCEGGGGGVCMCVCE